MKIAPIIRFRSFTNSTNFTNDSKVVPLRNNQRFANSFNVTMKGSDPFNLYQANQFVKKYTEDYNGLSLLTQANSYNKNSKKYEKAIEDIQNAGIERLTTPPQKSLINKDNPILWSVTSEFAPIKEGGLGSVPPEIRNNAAKLGVSVPTFVPMYEYEGNSTFYEIEGKPYYRRGNTEFELQKVVSFKMDTFKNGRMESVPIELYLSEDKDSEGNKRQLIFVKTDRYFDGSIYEPSLKSEESEKFAIFSKAVYEFLKLKTDGYKALKDVKVDSIKALNAIKEPDGLILNDWQASPIAAMLRYKAPMENAYNQLSDEAKEKLQDMKVVAIGHNCCYQGSSHSNNNFEQKISAANNLLNTIFDRYTYDIVKNARTGASEISPNKKDIQSLDNVLVLNAQNPLRCAVNFLNMGIVLSDYFSPVSKNYAQELTNPDKNNLSWLLQWALIQKEKSGRLVGIINGNDFNGLSIKAKHDKIKQTTGLDFKTYDKNSSAKELREARLENKINFYNHFILPFSESRFSTEDEITTVKELNPATEFYRGTQFVELKNLDDKTLENTPVLMSGGRLVSQKGMDVLCDSIVELFDNWETDFPGQNKPIIYIAGTDGENGKIRKIIEELKNERLSAEDASRVVFNHGGFAPMNALMAASDFFLMPSKFEPCGLTQGEALAVATPVVAAGVGGIVDTINRNGLFNGILTPKEENLSSKNFYEAMKKGLDIFFYDKKTYERMTQDALAEDFSWIQPDNKGPVFEYLDLMGIQK